MKIFQNNLYQKPLAYVLIIAVFFLLISPILLLPRKAQAQGCPVYVAGDAPMTTKAAKDSIWQGLDQAFQKGGLTQAIITAGELVSANASKMLEWASGAMLNILLHQILAMITNDIVNWIENGTTPRFISEGIGDYLSQATDNAIGNFIDQYLGAGWLCEPFDLDIKIALLDVPTFGEKAKCSLSDIVENINDFYDNFSKGGWKAWIELTKPQNNFYGALLLAQEEKMKVEAEAQKEVETDAQMGEGFLGQKDCRWWDAAGNLVEEQKDVRGIAKMPDVCKGKIGEEPKVPLPCRVQCQTKNPSTVIKAMANESVTNFFGWINSAMGGAIAKSGPLQVYVQAIANALINRTIKEGLILLKGEPEPLYVPKYGDIGASTSIPEIIDPEQVLQNKTNAATLIGNLDTLNENVETKLLNEQKNNLAVLEGLILPVYSNIIPVLDEIQTACLSTPYSSYIDWADSQKNGIEENIIPDINERISQFKLDISKSIETVNNIKTAIVSIQDYINKAEIWLNVYEKVNGELDNLELKTAETAMNAAENQAIKDTQEVLKEINGSVSSTDIIGLRQEVFDTNIIIITKAVNLEKERGNATWPEPGTLYAELESAQGLKSEANSKLNTCLNWTSL